MCLTLPKKVIEVGDGMVVVENFNGDRQSLKTLIELTIGDFVISQQNIVIEKMKKTEAEEIFKLIGRN